MALDVFNDLNRPNVTDVRSVYGTYNFCDGQMPTRYKDVASRKIQTDPLSFIGTCPAAVPLFPNPGFGAPRVMFNPRQLQLALKYCF